MSSTVVLNLFYMSYPFIKQDFQIYLQYTQWCSFIENTISTNSYSLVRMIYKNIHWLPFMVQ